MKNNKNQLSIAWLAKIDLKLDNVREAQTNYRIDLFRSRGIKLVRAVFKIVTCWRRRGLEPTAQDL